ncbi:chromosome partitioning protein ParA [Stenotrophomonas maltophilia]|uniref:ParA family protein n=1 Tax=Stenotrophomonas maltophilia TaxID=40324 RepID=UPI0010944896|nr:AAA family ATPase [Stenotrophomonas maltophilia]TGW15164.1 chromosome partitioning protein ParA [Stenotrophomonas maltophilia]
MKAVSVINFKGGVSKTTLSLHLACYLADTSRVLVVDVDHQSSLSIVILGQRLWNDSVAKRLTINNLFESFSSRKIQMPGDEIIVKNPFNAKDGRYDFYPSLDFVSAQFELDDTEIDLASTNFGNASLSDWEKRTLISKWLDEIDAHSRYDYVIFDCPPATKIVSQNALAASHSYIVPVIPDELSSRGVTHFQGLVDLKIDKKLEYLRQSARVPDSDVPAAYVPTTRMAAIVPSLVKTAGNAASGMTNIHTERLAGLRSQWGVAVTNEVGRHYIGVPESVNAGWPVWKYWGANATLDVKSMMTKICTELKQRIDSA